MYAYVSGDPINVVDPSGKIAPIIIGVAAAFVAADIAWQLYRNDYRLECLNLVEAAGAGLLAWVVASAPPALPVIAAAAVNPQGSSAVQRAVSLDWARASHIFRDAPGHVNPSTSSSAQRFARLFESVASNPANLNPGVVPAPGQAAGVRGFAQAFQRGQVWVHVLNGQVTNAGVNPVGSF